MWKSRFSHDTPKCVCICFIKWKTRFSYDTPNNLHNWCITTRKSRFSHDMPKMCILMHYYLGKQVFSWCALTCIFDALLVEIQVFVGHGKKCVYLMLITWKSRFSHDVPNSLYIWCFIMWKAGYLMTCKYVFIWCITTWKSRFSHDMPKTHVNMIHYYMEMQVLSRKNVHIWCIIMCRSKFSRDIPKTCISNALLRWKAGLHITRPKKLVYIWCFISLTSRFFHDVPKTCLFNALWLGKEGFSWCTKKIVYLMLKRFYHDMLKTCIFDIFYMEKQVFSWRPKMCFLVHYNFSTLKSRFSHDI